MRPRHAPLPTNEGTSEIRRGHASLRNHFTRNAVSSTKYLQGTPPSHPGSAEHHRCMRANRSSGGICPAESRSHWSDSSREVAWVPSGNNFWVRPISPSLDLLQIFNPSSRRAASGTRHSRADRRPQHIGRCNTRGWCRRGRPPHWFSYPTIILLPPRRNAASALGMRGSARRLDWG